jgi:hypothetical protein
VAIEFFFRAAHRVAATGPERSAHENAFRP